MLKIFLLLWKNSVYLKRHYIVSTCEFLLPVLAAAVLAYLKSTMEIPNYGGSTMETAFPDFKATEILEQLHNKIDDGRYGRVNFIGYTPHDGIEEKIVARLVDKIKLIKPPGENSTRKFVVRGFSSESKMEAFYSLNMLQQYYRDSHGNNLPGSKYDILFCLVFNGTRSRLLNSTVSYKIRMNGLFIDTKTLMKTGLPPGPYRAGAVKYVKSGFAGIQYYLDRILIEEYTKKQPNYTISMQAFPYPPYKNVDVSDLFQMLVSIFLVSGFVLIVPQVVRGVVSEKETGIKELMKMSGLSEWMHWSGWFLSSMTVLTVTVTITVVILFFPFNRDVGAAFVHSDPAVVQLVLMVYVIWAISYCFLVSACFGKASRATQFGIVLWLISFYSLGLAMQELYGTDFSQIVKMLFCLFPNVAICLALRIICDLEMSEAGAKWTNIHQSPPGMNGLTLCHVMLMFFVSIFLNMLLCFYMEAIMPKKYGVKQPFYYIFKPSEWGFGKRSSVKVSIIRSETLRRENSGFENEPKDIEPVVELIKLRKEFGTEKIALKDVSMNMFKGQIFCLLGQNGAGKSTTMSILTGMQSPSSGTAILNGYDINTDISKVRNNLGLCPQHNMLFDGMSVMEHLKFFGMLKGLTLSEATKEAKGLLHSLQMKDKINALSKDLSGGQKRKLSLGCALIGGSKIVILDEPTSGMDPEARRVIWNLLLKIRKERTIILSTHFMEEADVIGDRIAILASGVLQCCGSPNFLKRFYGTGYTLKITTAGGAKQDNILKTVCKHITNAYIKKSYANSPTEFGIVLPSDTATTAIFPNMFLELNGEPGLGIDKIGVEWTTMDEVFARVEKLSHNMSPYQSNITGSARKVSHTSKRLSGLQLTFSQFHGLMKKHVSLILRNKLFIHRIITPILLTLGALSIGHFMVCLNSDYEPDVEFTLSKYKNPITLYTLADKTVGESYASVIGVSAKPLDAQFKNNLSLGLLSAGQYNIAKYKEKYIVGAEFNGTHMKAMYSTFAIHAAPLSMNLLTNTILQLEAPNKDYQISASYHPFSDVVYDLVKQTYQNSSKDCMFALIFSMLVSVGLGLLAADFSIGPTEERFCKAKQLQLMTGVHPSLYWSSFFICDFLFAIIPVSLMGSALYFFESNKMFTSHGGLAIAIFILILVMYFLASIPFSYIFSIFVPGVTGGFSIITVIHLITGTGTGIASFVAEQNMNATSGLVKILNIAVRPFPTYGLTKALVEVVQISSYNAFCYSIPKEALNAACDPNLAVDQLPFPVSRECCENCAQLGGCFQPSPYFQWTKEVIQRDPFEHPVTYHVAGLTQDLVWLAIAAVIYFVALLVIESGLLTWVKMRLARKHKSFFKPTDNDSDVSSENERVDRLVKSKETFEDTLVVKNFCRSFGSFIAVSGLSFGLRPGECFGLLGVNGAGKTTTFRMLTGDETLSYGDAYMKNFSLTRDKKRFLSRLGYCPQFGGLLKLLSGKEMLCLFARLRGIHGDDVVKEAEKWLKNVGLTASANVQCQNYSGGMMRRLSAAVAFIGDPPIVLLDEPTSGVDPIARRQFWNIITSITNSNSRQAIILTSHSMEECEALCSRLGIMVNKKLRCLGGVQHLKNKFAQGYSLTVKLKKNLVKTSEAIKIEDLISSICKIFKPCSLKDHHQATVKFQIHSKSTPWEDLYGKMEGIKRNFQEVVEEYGITETTLEEVFLSFAGTQRENRAKVTDDSFPLEDLPHSSKGYRPVSTSSPQDESLQEIICLQNTFIELPIKVLGKDEEGSGSLTLLDL